MPLKARFLIPKALKLKISQKIIIKIIKALEGPLKTFVKNGFEPLRIFVTSKDPKYP